VRGFIYATGSLKGLGLKETNRTEQGRHPSRLFTVGIFTALR